MTPGDIDDRRIAPTAGGADELLDVLPEQDPAGGAFAGYAGSGRVRLFIGCFMAAGLVAAIWGGSLYADYLRDQERRGLAPEYDSPPTDVSEADRVMRWDGGAARLGLTRDAPGVNLIVLPDREIRLADGYDNAQLRVRVEGGRTVKLRVLTGRIDVTRTDK